jgi:hypothetical protein
LRCIMLSSYMKFGIQISCPKTRMIMNIKFKMLMDSDCLPLPRMMLGLAMIRAPCQSIL